MNKRFKRLLFILLVFAAGFIFAINGTALWGVKEQFVPNGYAAIGAVMFGLFYSILATTKD